MDIEKKELQVLSRYAGNRFDLVQAGGGNSSVKVNQRDMLVKASGINLSQLNESSGYVRVDYQAIRRFLAEFDRRGQSKKQRESSAAVAMHNCLLDTSGKPSIETFLHALLNKHTLHTHPLSVNVLAATANWKQDLLAVWPDAVCVAYNTPGIDLALAMQEAMQPYQKRNQSLPKVVFLQNHGLIVSCDKASEVQQLTEAVTTKIETRFGLDFSAYRAVTRLQHLMGQAEFDEVSIIYSEDQIIYQLLNNEPQQQQIWPFCPDTLIYCGVRPVVLSNFDDIDALKTYASEFHAYPRVIIVQDQIYICAPTLKKAKEAEELLKFHLIVVARTKDKTQRLQLDEIAYLSNWDAEKYRQGV